MEEDFFGLSDVYLINISSLSRFYRRSEPWLVFFYKGNDKKSKEYREEYKSLAEKMHGIIGVGAADCINDEEICEEFSVYSVPTVLLFTETLNDDPETYTGAIT